MKVKRNSSKKMSQFEVYRLLSEIEEWIDDSWADSIESADFKKAKKLGKMSKKAFKLKMKLLDV